MEYNRKYERKNMNESLFAPIYGLAHQSASFDQVIIFCAVWLPWLVGALAIIIALVLASRDQSSHPVDGGARRASFIISVPVIAWLVAHVIKIILAWPRPALVLDTVQPLFSADGAAFPSGHATLFFALGFALYPFHQRLATFVSMTAVVISLARVAAGVHFPGDILGGFLLAGLVTFISWTIVKNHFPTICGRERV